MAVEIKLAPDERLELVRAQITDTSLNSNYFNVTELSDTFSGGKNAFLIAGSELLEPNTEVKVQIKDSVGKVLYCEFSDGSPDEYYEGISKVVAVYVYPTETSFGPATITLVGQIRDTLDIVKWQRTINIDPSLPNTTRVRFYKRPIVSIVEELSPIYAFDATGSKVASLVTQSFANIKVSQLDTFAGDVKRVKVFRTSQGDISDYDLIQDILVESKELLTTTTLSGSVVGEAGLFTSETLQKLWNTGSLNAALTSSKIDNGLRLRNNGYLTYTSSLNLTNGNTYELGIDAFYSSSANSDMGIYISGSQNGTKLIGTLNGIVPTKNLEDQVFAFTLDKAEPTASLYLSQSQSEWHVGNISLKLSEDSAFSPSEISFVTSMPTVLGNETYNFKFEFYDVNNNYVPVAVTQSALFTGGNNNIGGTLILISGSTSASNASILALSQSVSGTISNVSSSVSGTISFTSASLQSSSLYISSSISGTISNVSSSISGTISNVSQSASSSLSLVSQSLSSSIRALSSSQATTFTDVNSRIFTDATGLVNKAPSNGVAGLYLGQSYLGYHNGNGQLNGWKTYMADNGNFFLTSSAANGGYLAWDSLAATLVIKGSIDITGGNAATTSSVTTAAANAALSGSNAATAVSNSLAPNIFTDSTGKVVRTPTNTASNYGLYLGSSNLGFYSASIWRTYMDNTGQFFLTGSASNHLKWDGSTLTIAGSINITGGQAATDISNAASSGSSALTYAIANNTTASIATTNLKIFTDAAGLVNRTATPVGSGLYMDSSHLGYYKSGAGWSTFMSSSGLFYLSGSAGNSLLWNGSGLEIRGAITATSITLISGVTIPNGSVAGLGSLALSSSVSTSQIQGLGALATLSSVNATYIDDNSVTTDKILANSIVAGKIASLEFFGKNARFDTGSIAGWNFNGNSLFKSNGTHTISLSSADASYFITRDSTNQTKVKISPATTIPAIAVSSFDFVNFQSPNQVRFTINGTGTQSLTTTLTATSGRGDTDAGVGYAGTGIIYLQYPTEEIWVDSDGVNGLTLLQFLATIAVNNNSLNSQDGVRANYSLSLVAEKYSNYTNAANRTNIIQTFRTTIADTSLLKLAGDVLEYTDYAYNISGGGFQVDSNSNWFYVYLEQQMDLITNDVVGNAEEDQLSVSMLDFGATIKVQFGRVDNGFSQLSPAGLQVYTGVRTYMNASNSGVAGESFFEVKGKSQFLSGLAVNGTFSATSKQFQITHPLNENKWLYHTSIEGPQADLIYRGKLNLINGEGSSNIDVSSRLTNGTFNSLTRNPQLFLQNNDSFDRIKGKIENGNVYVVSENENSSASIDWTVIAERCDVEVLTGGTYGGDGKYKTEKWKREFRNSLMITGSI